MSWKTRSNGDVTHRGTRTGSRGQPAHRWQDARKASGQVRARGRGPIRRWQLTALAAVGLVGLLVYILLVRQPKTQVIILTAADYSLPTPLNPWAAEDSMALKALDGKNLNPVTDISPEWQQKPDQKKLDDLLTEHIEHTKQPLIVYISMHGVVNDKKGPCLLPPGARPDETQRLIEVSSVLARISELVANRRKALVILDCQRIRANWQLGIVYNDFAERLRANAAEFKNVAVLCSAGPGQVNWASAELNGSAFGRFLQLGLAGAADTGDGTDGEVSLHELEAYLRREVNGWSQFNRGEPQQPVLLSDESEDFRVTYNVRGSDTLARLVRDFHESKPLEPKLPVPKTTPAQIRALWAQLDQLRTLEFNSDGNGKIEFDQLQPLDLVRRDPLACRDLELGLLQLEAMWQGGSAYAETADSESARLTKILKQAIEQAACRSVADHFGLDTIRVTAHALPIAEYFGTCDAETSERAGQLWSDPAKVADPSSVTQAANDDQLKELMQNLGEIQLLRAARAQRADSPPLWPDQGPLISALKLRDLAEGLAVPRGLGKMPGDERAHYFARHALEAADHRRRLVEDALFIGPRTDQDFAALVEDAEESYRAAGAVMQEATAAYVVRDVALAEAPYLAWWLCGPASLDVPDRKALIDEVLDLIRLTRGLDKEIASSEKNNEVGDSPETSGRSFRRLAVAAFERHQSIKAAFQRKYEDLLAGESQGSSDWIALNSALATPLISANQRASLLDKRRDISKQLFNDYAKAKGSDTAAPDDNDPAESNSSVGDGSVAPYLAEMLKWDAHPLVEILLPGANTRAETWHQDVAQRLQRRLVRLPSDGDYGSTEADPPGDNIAGDRHQLSRAESELRASASLGFGLGQTNPGIARAPSLVATTAPPVRGATETAPTTTTAMRRDTRGSSAKLDHIKALREFDLRRLLVWHGKRAMEDFWGDETNPFFAVAAKNYFEAASEIGRPTPAFEPDVRKLQDKLAQLQDAKRQLLKLRATPAIVDEEAGDFEVQVDVSAPRASYPAGEAALYLRNEQTGGRLVVHDRSAANSFLKYPPDSAAQSITIAIRPDPRDGPLAEAVSFFRGQEVTADFELQPFEGVSIVYAPHVYNSQSITLAGDDPEQLSLVFILDCSHSMAANTKVRAERADVRQRLFLAKLGLTSMLSDIALRKAAGDDTRVGVRFFGHRLAWSRAPENPPSGWRAKLMTNKRYTGRKPEKPNAPSEDIELVQPLGEFDKSVADDIAELLKTVEPHGETPFYLSLLQAFDDFNNDDSETRKSIIAITDGVDYQFDHPDFPQQVKITLSRLRSEYERRGLNFPIHILGFDLPPGEAKEAEDAYNEIAEFSGGSYSKIGSYRELLENLREHLNVDGYFVHAVSTDAASQSAAESIKLGQPKNVPSSVLPREFQVQFRGLRKQVGLEGGEAIQLYVEKQGASHEIVAHEYNELEKHPLTYGADSEPQFFLRAHRPERQQGSENAVKFPVSLQCDVNEFHFTPRPSETWLEITPLSVDASGQSKPQQPYVFYDTNFEPNEPVPVLVCPALGWRDWPKARIKFWCKVGHSTEPVLRIGLRDATYRTPQDVSDVNGVQIRVEPSVKNGVYRVYVAEKHGPQSPGVSNALRIQFQTHPRYKPIRVQHQFDSAAGLSTHSFEFNETDRQAIENYDGSLILVTRARDIKDGALQLAGDSAIEVPVWAGDGYHRTGAASSGQ